MRRSMFNAMSKAVVLLAAGLATMPALAQTQDIVPTFKWAVRGRFPDFPGANANDEGTCIGYFNEDPQGLNKHWVYSGGWVTELQSTNGPVKGTRFGLFQYDAKSNSAPAPTHSAYFPPQGFGISQSDTYKAYAMAVDYDPVLGTGTGDIYIVGEGPHAAGVANNQDYIIVRYDKDLQPIWTGSGLGVGRYYNGTGNGNDIPVAIVLDKINGVVVVTGTSPSTANGNDIATVAWHLDGSLATDLWPADTSDPIWPQPQGGVRRWDNMTQHGNDRAAGVVSMAVATPQETGLAIAVLGTTYNGAGPLDDFTTHYWQGTTPQPSWQKFFDLGLNDTAKGIQGAPDLGWVWCNGYSEIPSADKPGGEENDFDAPPTNVDYSIVSYQTDGSFRWSDYRDYNGGPDYAAPLTMQYVGTEGVHIWITGEGKNATTRDAFTIHYLDTGAGGHTPDFTTGFLPGTNFAYGTAVTLPTQTGIPVLPYITGAAGFNGGNDYELILKYKPNPTYPYIPKYLKDWNRLYDNGGPDEGRAIFVRQVDGSATNVSIYVVGASNASGNGRDLTLWRYRR